MTKTVVLVCFLVAFAAGLAVGFQNRGPAAESEQPKTQRCGGWLSAELNLTPEQKEQLDNIWSETARYGGRERMERRRQLYRERDEAIVALIRPEDQSKYDEILKKHTENMAALDREWRDSFHAAVEQTKQILTAEQREKYERLIERRHKDRGPRDRYRGKRGRGAARNGHAHSSELTRAGW